MRAVLKKIDVPRHDGFWPVHPMLMYFTESDEGDELYCYKTSVEQQFCTKEEFDIKVGLSDVLLEKKIEYGRSLVGSEFEVNLYKFSVKELTGSKYMGFQYWKPFNDNSDFEKVGNYFIASYMTKEDEILKLQQAITILAIQGHVDGILLDGSTEPISPKLFFNTPVTEMKRFNIPYSKYPNINADYILKGASLDEISKGHYLVNKIKESNISEVDFDKYLHQINDYRMRVRTAEQVNKSLRKKLFFWESKETIEELKLPQFFISLAIDSIILYKLYPSDCVDARKEYVTDIEKKLKKEVLGEDVDINEIRDRIIKSSSELSKKYKGKNVLRPIE